MHNITPSATLTTLIPRKTDFAVRLFANAPWLFTWSRMEKYIFQLVDGKRDIERIASLLTKSPSQIEYTLGKLLLNGSIAIDVPQGATLIMDVEVLHQSLPVLQERQAFFVEAFTARLRELLPDEQLPRSAFHPDLFVSTFSTVIGHLYSGKDIAPFVQYLVQQHDGVSKEQYARLRHAILELMELLFRDQPSVQKVWTLAYDILVREMRHGKRLPSTEQNREGGSTC